MKRTFYMIIENWTEPILEIGEFEEYLDACKYAYENSDNLAHGNSYIVMDLKGLKRVMNIVFKL